MAAMEIVKWGDRLQRWVAPRGVKSSSTNKRQQPPGKGFITLWNEECHVTARSGWIAHLKPCASCQNLVQAFSERIRCCQSSSLLVCLFSSCINQTSSSGVYQNSVTVPCRVWGDQVRSNPHWNIQRATITFCICFVCTLTWFRLIFAFIVCDVTLL